MRGERAPGHKGPGAGEVSMQGDREVTRVGGMHWGLQIPAAAGSEQAGKANRSAVKGRGREGTVCRVNPSRAVCPPFKEQRLAGV